MISINVWAVVAMVIAIVVALWWMMRLSRTGEADRWAQMKRALPTVKAFRGDNESLEFWNLIKETFYLPTWGEFTDDVVRHDLELIEVIVEAGTKQLTQAELDDLDAFDRFLKKTQGKPKPDRLKPRLKEALQKIVDSKLELSRKKSKGSRPMVPAEAR